MSDIRALRSYLVSLGFTVNTTQLNQFNNAIAGAARTVSDNSESMIKEILRWQGIAITAFVSVGAVAVATADKIAARDETYRIWGETMFLNAGHARVLKQALDAMGYSLGQISFDPELHARMKVFMGMLQTLEGQQPGGTEGTLRTIRAIRAEFTMFQFEIEYFIRAVIVKLFNALGGEKFLERLRSINNYIVRHIPEWSDIFARDVLPVLRMTWAIMSDIWQIAKDLATLFTNVVGLFSMDKSLMGVANLEKFSHALSKVALFLGTIVRLLLWIQGTLFGAAGGAAIGATIGSLGGPIGAAGGALLGAGAGAVFDVGRHMAHGVSQVRDTYADSVPALPAATGLDAITSAVSQVESGGHQLDRHGNIMRSSVGALGVMQLMPGTARQLGVDPYNAAQNLAGGRAYLAQLYGKFGNWHDALAAYNWGPGNVQRALRLHRAFPTSVEGYTRTVGSHIGSVTVNIMQPHATPEQITTAVSEGIRRERGLRTSSTLAELKGGYG